MKKTFLTQKRKKVIYSNLKQYLFEAIEDDENFEGFNDVWNDIERVYGYPAAQKWTRAKRAEEWLKGLSLSVVFCTHDIQCMLYMWNGMDYEKEGDNFNDNYLLDEFYWATMGEIIAEMAEAVEGGKK